MPDSTDELAAGNDCVAFCDAANDSDSDHDPLGLSGDQHEHLILV